MPWEDLQGEVSAEFAEHEPSAAELLDSHALHQRGKERQRSRERRLLDVGKQRRYARDYYRKNKDRRAEYHRARHAKRSTPAPASRPKRSAVTPEAYRRERWRAHRRRVPLSVEVRCCGGAQRHFEFWRSK